MPSASCCFLHVFYIAGNQYQKESKRSETFCGIFMDQKTPNGPEKHLEGAPRGTQPTRARLGPQARQGGLCPPGPGAPRWVVPTSVASCTPSLHYKFPNIPKPLGVNLDQKFHRRRAPYPPKTNLDPFRHPVGGGNQLRWPSSSSRRPPR